ncbi:AAA family ATPase [Actinoplanes sp. CA-015351]|uniref:AAA family ATPase n=1 Tax=Actinoplanes sp. CA-015351 TaxID=3239897 RepID=UPI003D99AD52
MQTDEVPARLPELEAFSQAFTHLTQALEREVFGKHKQVQRSLICLVAGGHLLLDDVPGVGKTTLARALAGAVEDATTSRIQGTPDLLPSDIIGNSIYDRETGEFTFRPGPVVANIVLFDEINRCAPRTQSAMLEAMQERRVTAFRHEQRLPDPFMVIGTQNPQETLGTYPLPEAQLDRFLMRLTLGYPDRNPAREMLKAQGSLVWGTPASVTPERGIPARQLRAMAEYASRLPVADSVYDYLLDVIDATRNSPEVALGASPRASAELLRASRVNALLRWERELGTGRIRGEPFLRPDDIREIAVDVLAHRIVLSGARSTADAQRDMMTRIIDDVRVPQDHTAHPATVRPRRFGT